MTRLAATALLAAFCLAGCKPKSAPMASDDAVAQAAAERKAVADVDAARRDAAASPAEQSSSTPG